MRLRISGTALVGLGLTLGLANVTGQQAPPPEDFVPGEVIVQFDRNVSATARAAILAQKGATSLKKYDFLDTERVALAPGRNVSDAVNDFQTSAGVVAASPNYLRHKTQAQNPPPNDPSWLNGSLYGMVRISAQQAWNQFGGGNGNVVIANIDTGVDYNHPDLAVNIWINPGEIPGNGIDDDTNGYVDDIHGIDAVNNDSNPIDDDGHGTHTAGTSAAVGNNGIGVVGVNWNQKVLICKFLDANGNGTDGNAIECFNYIVFLKTQRSINIRVSSNSWGGGGNNPALSNAILAAGNAGIINIFAAGNGGADQVGDNNDVIPFYPASYPLNSIVSVASSNSLDNRSGFSNFGATSVDLAAPGSGILSTFPNNSYGSISGTSMATPHVAGAAAYLAALDPTLSVDSIKQILMTTVDVLPQWQGIVVSGGRLNLFAAAQAVGPPPPGLTNWALASNGGVAAASSTYSAGYAPSGAINGDRRGLNWGAGGGWNDATAGDFTNEWLEVTFNGQKAIQEVNVFTLQDNYGSPIEPTQATTFSLYGIQNLQIQTWNGAAWVTVPGGSITNNNLVWRQVTFSPIITTKVRVLVTQALGGFSRIVELEARGNAANGTPPTVSLTQPAEGQTYTAPANVHFEATATDSDGVAQVQFFANGNPVGTDATAPYQFDWAVSTPGSYALTAVATDTLGASATSNTRNIVVNPAAGRSNVALASNGGVAAGSSTFSSGYAAAGANNGDRRGLNWGNGGGWNDATANSWVDEWLEVTFNGLKSIDEINVVTLQDNFGSPIEPTPSTTFTQYGIQNFQLQYWTGASWLTVPGGSITGNNLVWRQVTFSPVVTTKVRVLITQALNSYSRVTELEAWGTAANNIPPMVSLTSPSEGSVYNLPGALVPFAATASDSDGTITQVQFKANGAVVGTDTIAPYSFDWTPPAPGNYALTAVATDNGGSAVESNVRNIVVNGPPGQTNWALASNGGVASASSTFGPGFAPSGANNGDRRGLNWEAGGGWNDATPDNFSNDWLEIQFNGTKSITEINVFTVQDNYLSPIEPTQATTFSLYGILNFQVQYWTGAAWQTVPGGSITGNNLVWRQVTFAPVQTTAIRVLITQALSSYSRIVEVEALGVAVPAPAPAPEPVQLTEATPRQAEPPVAEERDRR